MLLDRMRRYAGDWVGEMNALTLLEELLEVF
jgi:hypothetical protein